MRIRVRDLIEELQRFDPDDLVVFRDRTPPYTHHETPGRTGLIDPGDFEFDGAWERGAKALIAIINP